MDACWIFWLIIAVILVIVEIATLWVSTMCFAVGSLGAMIVALCGGGLTYQLIVLAVASVATFLIFGEKIASLQRTRANKHSMRTNADALLGRECEVSEDIPLEGKGRVKVDGDNWLACGVNGEAIAVGSKVRIIARDSIIMTVEKI